MGFEECLSLLPMAPVAEIRLDSVPLTSAQMEEISRQKPRWVATCRPGGLYEGESRQEQLIRAVRAGAAYVDVEYEAEASVREAVKNEAKNNGCKLIISYHNFETTPSLREMRYLVEASFGMGADRVKLVTTVKNTEECARLMALYSLYERVIVFGMGSVGKVTRVAAPLLGADFTYGAISADQATAPGQMTIEELEKVYALIAANAAF